MVHSLLRRQSLILLAGIFTFLYTLAVLGYVLTTPDIGLDCPFSTEINGVRPGFNPLGETSAPKEGDLITKIGGQRVDNWQQLHRHLKELGSAFPHPIDSFSSALEKGLGIIQLEGNTWVRVEYTSATEAPEETTWRWLAKFLHRHSRTDNLGPPESTAWRRLGRPGLETVLPSILWFLLKLGLFIVGALVFWKRPNDPSASQFFLLCLVTIGAFMGGYHWLIIITQPLLLLIFMSCSVLWPAVSLHFYLLFPRPKEFFQRRRNLTLTVIYGLPLLFLLLLVVGFLTVRQLYDPVYVAPATEPLLIGLLFLVLGYFGVAALWFLGCIVSLVNSFRSAANLTERNQVKWILYGALAALVPIGYTLYLIVGHFQDFGSGAATWPMFAASVCFTVAFAISITRYRLMQLDQLISSGVSYFLISSLAGLLYYALAFLGMLVVGRHVNPGPPLGQVLWVSSTTLVLLVILDLARGRLKRILDRHFRREKHQLDHTLRRLSQAIEQLVDPPALARRLLHTSAELLGVIQGAVYLRQGEPHLYVLADTLGAEPPLTELPPGCPLVEAILARGTLNIHKRVTVIADPAHRQLRFLGGAVGQALIHEGQMHAILLLGPKEVGDYGPDDLNLLAAFAQLTVLALVSAEGHRTVEGLNRELQTKVEKIAEQQRRILALQAAVSRQQPVLSSPSPSPPGPESAEAETVAERAPGGIIGNSPQVRHLLHLVRKVAASQSEVLILGESGTGKELLAQALHETSPRANKPFVKVHCAALSPSLLESELFGHVKGAFTGAHRDKVGRFELANGGTLFLDEIGDIDLSVQTKLLRVLQEMTFERVGSSEPIQVAVRVLAATNQDLEALIRQNRFRGDLYYRLNVISITVPPLRERSEDIPELVQHFLRKYGPRGGKQDVQIEDEALMVLKACPWPGNIRQLENVVERAVVFAEGPAVTVADLPPELWEAAGNGEPTSSDFDQETFSLPGGGIRSERAERNRRERERLVRALAAAKGNKAEAARALGMARSTLVSRLKKHGLQ